MAMTVICIVVGIGNAVVGSVDELAIHNFFPKHVQRIDSFVCLRIKSCPHIGTNKIIKHINIYVCMVSMHTGAASLINFHF